MARRYPEKARPRLTGFLVALNTAPADNLLPRTTSMTLSPGSSVTSSPGCSMD